MLEITYFYDFVQALPFPVAGITAEGRVDYLNAAFLHLLGYTLAEIPTVAALLTTLWATTEQRACIEARLEAPTDAPQRCVIICKSGETRVAQLRLICSASTYKFLLLEDLTESQTIYEALHNSEMRLKAILDNSQAVIYLKDIAGRYLLVNRYYEYCHGFTNTQVQGKTDHDIFPADVAARLRANDMQVLAAGRALEFEERIAQQDGWHIYLSSKFPIHDAEGQLVGLCGISTDITKRKQAEFERELLLADLRHRSTQLHTAAEIAKSAITILDPEKLMAHTAELIRERFAFYYVGIFLVNEGEEYAVLRAGSGEAGQKMLAAGHRLRIGGHSMIGWCVAHAQARIALDVGEEAVRFDNPLLPATRSEMALPLRARDRAIGALTVQSIQEAAFTEDDVAVLQAMADQLATAIQNAWLFESLQDELRERTSAQVERERLLVALKHRTTQLETAAEIAQSAITLLDPETLMAQTVELIGERFEFYYVGIFLVDDNGGYAVLRAGTGDAGRQMLAARHRLAVGGKSMIGACVAEARARIALDVGEEAVRFENPFLPATRSEMALPLVSRGKAIGALTVQSAREAAFSEEDIAILQAMADQLATAIQNARLFEAAQQEIAKRIEAEAEVRQLNELLEQRVIERTAQLEAANRELEAFSYSVSHDLRAPLRAIDGFSQAVLEDYQAQVAGEGEDYLRRIRAASQHMAQLIDDILKLSRLNRGELVYEEVNLSTIAADIIADLQLAYPERVVEVNLTPHLMARGDTRLLRIMLTNLLGNAWKFTRQRLPAKIELGYTTLEGRVTYFVRDNGAGFDMKYADKLFGAFQRLHRATEFEGTGIGLATVQRIINRHGGKVWAESAIDAGATFYFTLGAGVAAN